MSEPSAEQTASPHPRFASHFTAAIYDPDGTGPFDNDEGADLFAEWSGRTDELESLSLREMLNLNDDPIDSASGPSDLDDAIIAAGFTHLRATGWLDREGAAWVRSALLRRAKERPGTAYATMLDDLATYTNKPPRIRKPLARRGWIRIRPGGGDGPVTRWCRQNEEALDRALDWKTWWESTPHTTLDFYPHLGPKENYVESKQEGSVLVVVASTRELGRLTTKHLSGTVTAETPPLPSLMTLPNFRNLLDDLLLSALQTAAVQERLQTPPADLPTLPPR